MKFSFHLQIYELNLFPARRYNKKMLNVQNNSNQAFSS